MNTRSTVYTVVDELLAMEICEKLDIEPVLLLKPCRFEESMDNLAKRPHHSAIYPKLTVNGHSERRMPTFITYEDCMGFPFISLSTEELS